MYTTRRRALWASLVLAIVATVFVAAPAWATPKIVQYTEPDGSVTTVRAYEPGEKWDPTSFLTQSTPRFTVNTAREATPPPPVITGISVTDNTITLNWTVSPDTDHVTWNVTAIERFGPFPRYNVLNIQTASFGGSGEMTVPAGARYGMWITAVNSAGYSDPATPFPSAVATVAVTSRVTAASAGRVGGSVPFTVSATDGNGNWPVRTLGGRLNELGLPEGRMSVYGYHGEVRVVGGRRVLVWPRRVATYAPWSLGPAWNGDINDWTRTSSARYILRTSRRYPSRYRGTWKFKFYVYYDEGFTDARTGGTHTLLTRRVKIL